MPERAQDLMLVDKNGGAPTPLLVTDADESWAQFSPDGKWVVYQSDEGGQRDIYVRDFSADGTPAFGRQKFPISAAGGRAPRWSGDSIYYLQGTTLMRVTVQTEPTFQAGAATVVMDLPTVVASRLSHDVLRDGGFVVNTVVELPERPAPPMRVVLNWPVLLNR